MPGPVIPPIGNPENSSFVTELNAALQTLAGEFNSVVYRDGTVNLTDDLDINSKRLFNLVAPVGPTEPLRLADVGEFQGVPGTDAATPDWTIDVVTGVPGTDAEVAVVGTYPTQTITLTVPRGFPGASGALGDAVYSGIVVSGTGTALDVVDNHITFARMADLGGAGVIGGLSAGDPTLLTFATLKGELDLDNVDNTADADKPVSTATQAALDLKQNAAPNVSDNVVTTSPFAPDGTKDLVIIRGLSTSLTINQPTGTPPHGHGLVIRIKDTGTSRVLGWSGNYRVMSGVTLPTSTVIGKTHYIAMIWNETDSEWDVISVNVEA